jgi:oxaloacetate decarboxylase gamma subunit
MQKNIVFYAFYVNIYYFLGLTLNYFCETSRNCLLFRYWSDYSNCNVFEREERMDNMQQQFVEAGTLMFAGMVFVFAFLGVLIIFINTVLARLAVKYPDAVVAPPSRSSKKSKSKTAAGEISPAVVAAISGAVKRYRTQHGQDK